MTSKSERESAVMHLQEPRVQLSSQLFVSSEPQSDYSRQDLCDFGSIPRVFTVNFLISVFSVRPSPYTLYVDRRLFCFKNKK